MRCEAVTCSSLLYAFQSGSQSLAALRNSRTKLSPSGSARLACSWYLVIAGLSIDSRGRFLQYDFVSRRPVGKRLQPHRRRGRQRRMRWCSNGSIEHANACVLQRSMVHASGSSPASRLIRQLASDSAVFRWAGVSVTRTPFAAKLSLTTQSPGCCAERRSSSLLPTGQSVGSPHPQRWSPARLQQLVRRRCCRAPT
jgi:hypothetical protein